MSGVMTLRRSEVEDYICSKIGKHLLHIVINYSLPERIVYPSTYKWYKQYYNIIDELHYISFYYSVANSQRFRIILHKKVIPYADIIKILKSHRLFVDMSVYFPIKRTFQSEEINRFDEKNGILDLMTYIA
jgi:hypothetical protein